MKISGLFSWKKAFFALLAIVAIGAVAFTVDWPDRPEVAKVESLEVDEEARLVGVSEGPPYTLRFNTRRGDTVAVSGDLAKKMIDAGVRSERTGRVWLTYIIRVEYATGGKVIGTRYDARSWRIDYDDQPIGM